LSLQGRHKYDLVVKIDELENEITRILEVWFSSLTKLTILITIDCFKKENWVSIFKHFIQIIRLMFEGCWAFRLFCISNWQKF
jgi:hypothetical protein